MKKVIVLTFMLCAYPFVACGANADKLNLRIVMTTGERSRDSSSTTTSIAITGETIVYNVAYGGRNRGREPEQKEFKLDAADKKRLIALIKSRNLLVTKSVERSDDESGISTYFELSLRSEVNSSKGLVSMKGPRKAPDIKESTLYKDAVALIDAVYEIIHRTDPKLDYESLIY